MEHETDTLLNVHSIRLFPKSCGADAYQITGIAARCDYVILSDHRHPQIHVHRNVDTTSSPRHIFLSMRSPFVALKYFTKQILPTLNSNFILITGSEDITIPNQCDRRKRKFNIVERLCINQILNNPYLSHWFCENLDDSSHPLMSPIPTGMVFRKNYPKAGILVPNSPPLSQRPMRILCAHRIRNDSQWDTRRQVTKLALSDWSPWCTVLEEEVSENRFLELIHQHAFVLCVEGGGLDPSPKAWQTILNGSIPIIRTTALQNAYKELPVAFVPSWESHNISAEILKNWYAYFLKMYENKSFESFAIQKLGIDYWWDKILEYYNESLKKPVIKRPGLKYWSNKILLDFINSLLSAKSGFG